MLAAPQLAQQWARLQNLQSATGGRSPDERAALLDKPAVAVAREIAEAVPPDACVQVLAYAGPAAIDYYDARFDYLLYPRRSQVTSDWRRDAADCSYVAVFRDTAQNLQAEPYSGDWDEAALQQRLSQYQAVHSIRTAAVYKKP